MSFPKSRFILFRSSVYHILQYIALTAIYLSEQRTMTLLTHSAYPSVGKEQYIYALESLSNNGTFWARVHKPGEDDQRFIDAMARMGLVGLYALYFSNPCLIYKAKAVPSSSLP